MRRPACTTRASANTLPVSAVTGRWKRVCRSIVVATRPAGSTDCTALPSALSSSVVMMPPCTEPIML